MREFENRKVAELVKRVKVGFVGSINKFYCQKHGGIPLIRTTDITNNGIDFSNLKYVTKAFHLKNKKSQIKKGDLIIARHGENGKANVFNEEFEAQVLNAVIIEPDNKQLPSQLLKYFFETDFVKRQISGFVKGSVQGVINTAHVSEVILPINSKINYESVCTLLRYLDDKIELNNKINVELEAMAKTLYDYWFVQFDFPGQSGRPYKSSGGAMVWNEQLKREIPEGWEVKSLGEILLLEYGKPLKESARSGTGYPVYGSNGVVGYHKDYLIKGPGIIVGRKGSAGEVIRTGDNFFPIDTAYYVIDSLGNVSLNYHYQVLKNCNLKSLESSSAVPGLNRNMAHAINVVLPNLELVRNYSKLVDALYLHQDLNLKQNQTLSYLRDWLLPMLMNGQVSVRETYEKVEEALSVATEGHTNYKNVSIK